MTPRRGTAALLATVLALAVVLAAAVPAQAASKYRFWSYWFAAPGASSWTYAPIGPAGHRVDDGGVEGWRFTVAVPNPSAPAPRTSAASAFASICGGTERPEGKDRVALVVDFGTSAESPPGEHPPTSKVRGTCVVVPDRSNGLTVLAQAGYSVRQDGSALVCSLQGYPRSECGVVVKASPRPKPTATPTASSSKSSKPKPSTAPSRSSAGSETPDAVPDGTSGASPQDGQPGGASPGASPPSASDVAAPTASPSGVALQVGPPPDDPGSSGSPLGLLLGVVAVAAVTGAAVWRNRLGRSPS